MTWASLVFSYSALRIELVGTLVLRLVLWLLPTLFFLLFDVGLPSLAEAIKHYGATSLPRRDAVPLLKKLLLALGNLVLFTAVQALLSVAAAKLFKGPLFTTSTTLPLPWQIVKHVALLFAAREVLTYYIHKHLLHARGPLAAWHKAFAHAHRGAPYALLTYADHPLPLLLHRLLPAYLPALLLRPHLLTYFVFTLLATLEEVLTMSGYSIVPGLVLGGIARRHATHYACRGRGNYSSWGLLDLAHGTNVGRDVIDELQDEADRYRAKKRSAAASSSSSSTRALAAASDVSDTDSGKKSRKSTTRKRL